MRSFFFLPLLGSARSALGTLPTGGGQGGGLGTYKMAGAATRRAPAQIDI